LVKRLRLSVSAYALEPTDFVTPLIRDLGAVLVKGIRPRDIFAQYMAKSGGPSVDAISTFTLATCKKVSSDPSHIWAHDPVMTEYFWVLDCKARIVGIALHRAEDEYGRFHEGLNFAAVQRLHCW